MTKHSSLPYVLVSEFSRSAAKALDERRDQWFLAKKSDVAFGSIPQGDEYKVEIDQVNHEELLNDYLNLEMNIARTMEEVVKLQKYLSVMGYGIKYTGDAMLFGKRIDFRLYKAHRVAIVELCEYKKILGAKLKMQLTNYRKTVGQKSAAITRDIALHKRGRDAELLREVLYILRFCSALYEFPIPEEFNEVRDRANRHIEQITEDFVLSMGIDKVRKHVDLVTKNSLGKRAEKAQIIRLVKNANQLTEEQVSELIDRALEMKAQNEK